MEPQAALLSRLTRVLASQPGQSLPERLGTAFTQIVGRRPGSRGGGEAWRAWSLPGQGPGT